MVWTLMSIFVCNVAIAQKLYLKLITCKYDRTAKIDHKVVSDLVPQTVLSL